MTDETKPAVSVDALPTCPECGRRQAQSAGDAARGLCPKRWAPCDELAEKDCSRHAALTAQGQEPMAWPIETDDQVEVLARECDWDNRKYMTVADYAIWCERMRKFAKLAAITAPAQPVGVPLKDWPHHLNEAMDALISALQWLKNIRDGVSTVEDALANTESMITHVYQAIEDQPPLYAAPQPPAEGGPTHRHKKRGSTYTLIGIGKIQAEGWSEQVLGAGEDGRNEWQRASVDMREVTIYRSTDDGSLWVRPIEEFNDGRFEALPPAPANGGDIG